MIRNYIRELAVMTVGPYAAVPVLPTTRGGKGPCTGCWFFRRGLCASVWPDACKGEYRYRRGRPDDILVDTRGVKWRLVWDGGVNQIVVVKEVRNDNGGST